MRDGSSGCGRGAMTSAAVLGPAEQTIIRHSQAQEWTLARKEWKIVDVYYMRDATAVCMCEHAETSDVCVLLNTVTQALLVVGLECAMAIVPDAESTKVIFDSIRSVLHHPPADFAPVAVEWGLAKAWISADEYTFYIEGAARYGKGTGEALEGAATSWHQLSDDPEVGDRWRRMTETLVGMFCTPPSSFTTAIAGAGASAQRNTVRIVAEAAAHASAAPAETTGTHDGSIGVVVAGEFDVFPGCTVIVKKSDRTIFGLTNGARGVVTDVSVKDGWVAVEIVDPVLGAVRDGDHNGLYVDVATGAPYVNPKTGKHSYLFSIGDDVVAAYVESATTPSMQAAPEKDGKPLVGVSEPAAGDAGEAHVDAAGGVDGATHNATATDRSTTFDSATLLRRLDHARTANVLTDTEVELAKDVLQKAAPTEMERSVVTRIQSKLTEAALLTAALQKQIITEWDYTFAVKLIGVATLTPKQADVMSRIEGALAGFRADALVPGKNVPAQAEPDVDANPFFIAASPNLRKRTLDDKEVEQLKRAPWLNDYEKQFISDHGAKTSLTESQTRVWNSIEAKLAAGEKFNVAHVMGLISEWECTFAKQNAGRENLSPKQHEVQKRIDEKLNEVVGRPGATRMSMPLGLGTARHAAAGPMPRTGAPAHHEAVPTEATLVGFGKHRELTYRQLLEREPAYCDWVRKAMPQTGAMGALQGWLQKR